MDARIDNTEWTQTRDRVSIKLLVIAEMPIEEFEQNGKVTHASILAKVIEGVASKPAVSIKKAATGNRRYDLD